MLQGLRIEKSINTIRNFISLFTIQISTKFEQVGLNSYLIFGMCKYSIMDIDLRELGETRELPNIIFPQIPQNKISKSILNVYISSVITDLELFKQYYHLKVRSQRAVSLYAESVKKQRPPAQWVGGYTYAKSCN